jgi:hypothetical protein
MIANNKIDQRKLRQIPLPELEREFEKTKARLWALGAELEYRKMIKKIREAPPPPVVYKKAPLPPTPPPGPPPTAANDFSQAWGAPREFRTAQRQGERPAGANLADFDFSDFE